MPIVEFPHVIDLYTITSTISFFTYIEICHHGLCASDPKEVPHVERLSYPTSQNQCAPCENGIKQLIGYITYSCTRPTSLGMFDHRLPVHSGLVSCFILFSLYPKSNVPLFIHFPPFFLNLPTQHAGQALGLGSFHRPCTDRITQRVRRGSHSKSTPHRRCFRTHRHLHKHE